MLRFLPALIALAVSLYALIDCIQTDEDKVRHMPKLVWILIILIAPLVGGLAWLFIGRDRTKPKPAGPRGPDDDPDFLRGI